MSNYSAFESYLLRSAVNAFTEDEPLEALRYLSQLDVEKMDAASCCIEAVICGGISCGRGALKALARLNGAPYALPGVKLSWLRTLMLRATASVIVDLRCEKPHLGLISSFNKTGFLRGIYELCEALSSARKDLISKPLYTVLGEKIPADMSADPFDGHEDVGDAPRVPAGKTLEFPGGEQAPDAPDDAAANISADATSSDARADLYRRYPELAQQQRDEAMRKSVYGKLFTQPLKYTRLLRRTAERLFSLAPVIDAGAASALAQRFARRSGDCVATELINAFAAELAGNHGAALTGVINSNALRLNDPWLLAIAANILLPNAQELSKAAFMLALQETADLPLLRIIMRRCAAAQFDDLVPLAALRLHSYSCFDPICLAHLAVATARSDDPSIALDIIKTGLDALHGDPLLQYYQRRLSKKGTGIALDYPDTELRLRWQGICIAYLAGNASALHSPAALAAFEWGLASNQTSVVRQTAMMLIESRSPEALQLLYCAACDPEITRADREFIIAQANASGIELRFCLARGAFRRMNALEFELNEYNQSQNCVVKHAARLLKIDNMLHSCESKLDLDILYVKGREGYIRENDSLRLRVNKLCAMAFEALHNGNT